jgi:hypothetical protein
MIETDGDYVLGGLLDGSKLGQEPPEIGTQIPAIKIAPGMRRVSIDCNGYDIINDAGYANRGVGIGGRIVANVSINHCKTRGSGMLYGVLIDNSANRSFGNITIKNSSMSATFRGIMAMSDDTTVGPNINIRDVGGQAIWPDGNTIGIEVRGQRAVITHVRVWILWNRYAGEIVGIACSGRCNDAKIEANEVGSDNFVPKSWGVWLDAATGYEITNNMVRHLVNGYAATSDTHGMAIGNQTSEVANPYSGAMSAPSWIIARGSLGRREFARKIERFHEPSIAN